MVPSEIRSLVEKHIDKIYLSFGERVWRRLDFISRHRERFAGDSREST
jgi:hypothetical protein